MDLGFILEPCSNKVMWCRSDQGIQLKRSGPEVYCHYHYTALRGGKMFITCTHS